MTFVKNILTGALDLILFTTALLCCVMAYSYCDSNRIPIIASVFFLIFIGVLCYKILDNPKMPDFVRERVNSFMDGLFLLLFITGFMFVICNICAFGGLFWLPMVIGFIFLSLVLFSLLIPLLLCFCIYDEYDSSIKYIPIACVLVGEMYYVPKALGFLKLGVQFMITEATKYFESLGEMWSALF